MKQAQANAVGVVLISVVLVLGGSGFAGEKHGRHASAEQQVYSAEDLSVEKPVPLPTTVLDILKKDKTVQNVLEAENLSPESLPRSWFSASVVHLSRNKKDDLVVVGNPPVSGGNLAMFWVFRATGQGYNLVLSASAHSLHFENPRWNGYRTVQLTGFTAMEYSKVWYRFEAGRYIQYKEKSGKIEELRDR